MKIIDQRTILILIILVGVFLLVNIPLIFIIPLTDTNYQYPSYLGIVEIISGISLLASVVVIFGATYGLISLKKWIKVLLIPPLILASILTTTLLFLPFTHFLANEETDYSKISLANSKIKLGQDRFTNAPTLYINNQVESKIFAQLASNIRAHAIGSIIAVKNESLNKVTRYLSEHTSNIIGISSSDNNSILSWDSSGKLIYWNILEGKSTWHLSAGEDYNTNPLKRSIFLAAFSIDNDEIAALTSNGTSYTIKKSNGSIASQTRGAFSPNADHPIIFQPMSSKNIVWHYYINKIPWCYSIYNDGSSAFDSVCRNDTGRAIYENKNLATLLENESANNVANTLNRLKARLNGYNKMLGFCPYWESNELCSKPDEALNIEESDIHISSTNNSLRTRISLSPILPSLIGARAYTLGSPIHSPLNCGSLDHVWTDSLNRSVIFSENTGHFKFFDNKTVGNVFLSACSKSKRLLFSFSDALEIQIHDLKSTALLAKMQHFSDGTWVVTDPEGRFDTADLESMPHLHWVMPDDPFAPVPLEAFMKDYYEPRLLARILAGETFKPVRALTSLNRTQTEVKIISVVPDAVDPSLVRVTVAAAGATKSYLQGEGAGSKEVPRPTAVHDLRLFRDSQVVGYADGKLADFKGTAFSKTFTVRLPKDKAGKDVVFSAYAFNDDRVKSETVRSTYKAPALPISTAAAKGKAYVISMGVNSHDNTAWNLNFAANDARLVRQSVSERLAKLSQYQDIVAITLVSDNKDRQASKAALHAVLARLAGKPLNAAATALLQTIQGANNLQTVTPDDLFLLSFSGHGFADDSGNFYLIPQDTGPGSGKAVTAELRQHSISSEELSLWLRDVDAGDMTMIVDACQSAATVGNDFKPGPMGSRGLGQLSFDKGMRILAASQADEYALEDGKLQQGLLSFSLVTDGLNAFNADREPKDGKIMLDEWLRYGVFRVPSLAEEMKSGKVVVAGTSTTRAAVSVNVDGSKSTRPTQQPALFDFAKKRKAVELAREVAH